MRKVDQLIRHFEQEGPVVLLESQSESHPESKRSYLAADPAVTISGHGHGITLLKEGEMMEYRSNPWTFLSEFIAANKNWMVGYLGYDLKNSLESLSSDNSDPVGAPDFFFIIPGFLAEINPEGGISRIIRGEEPQTLHAGNGPEPHAIGKLQSTVSKQAYMSHIEEAQRRITEGDFYEVNLSHQQQAEFGGDPYHLYRSMSEVGPVPFGAYLSFADIAVCSLSPERFLKREGKSVFSQPIKGTIGRGQSPDEDLKLKRRLEQSVKDRAENLMIVDLVRNDLSRIAGKKSVRVKDLFQVQTFGTIHQMVSTVMAETEVEDPIEILKACYPMGSMTGAPKISAMKAIEELESYRRGIYSGAIGYIKPDGDFDFNVVIRTAIIKGSRLFYSVGGAITGDSSPEEEWQETKVKTKALTDIMR